MEYKNRARVESTRSFHRECRKFFTCGNLSGSTQSTQEAEREKERLVAVAEERKKQKKAHEKAELMARRAAEHKQRTEAARAGAVARDAAILQRQREARRQRVYEDRVNVKNEFNTSWEEKLRERVESEMAAAQEWLESDPQAPFKVQKEMHILKRRFFAAPAPETAELERALADPSNAIFARMANILYKDNKTLHTFFHQFDKEVGCSGGPLARACVLVGRRTCESGTGGVETVSATQT